MTKIYAECIVIKGDGRHYRPQSYTVGGLYEVLPPLQDDPESTEFSIIDDAGEPVPCWWDHTDPDCVWQRVEFQESEQ